MNADAMRKLRGRYGMLFQSGALLQSLTVAETVALPLNEHTQLDAGLIDTVVKMKLEQVGLTGHQKPSEISGGMKARRTRPRTCLGSASRLQRRTHRRPRSHHDRRGR